MNTKLDTRALAIAGALGGAILVTLCFGLYAIAGVPDPWMDLFLGSGPTVTGWLVGIAEGAIVGAVTAWLIALFYNRFLKAA